MRPKRRPPRPKHPKFTHFHRSGLRFGRFPAQHRSIGGVGRPRRDRRTWPRCPWAVAGPGRIARQRAKPDLSTPGPTGVEGPEGSGGPGRGAGGRWRGLAGSRDNAPSQISVHQAPLVWRAPKGLEDLAAVPVGGGGAWPGIETTHRTRKQRPGTTGVEGPGGTGGPGCGARGRWRGLAGLRDRPLRAAGSRVAISRAGRRPRRSTA